MTIEPNREIDKSPTTVFPGIIHVTILVIVTLLLMLMVGIVATLFGKSPWIFLTEAVIVLPALFFVMIAGAPFSKVFRIRIPSWQILQASVLVAVGAFVLADQLDRLIQAIFPVPDIYIKPMEELLKINTVEDGIIIIFSAVVLAGVCEEMLFRGIFQGTLEVRWNPKGAVLVTAGLFAFIHILPWTLLQIFLLGLVLGLMAMKSGSIMPGVIVHASNNLFSVIFMNLGPERTAWYASDLLVNPIILIGAAIAIIIGLMPFVKHQPLPPFTIKSTE